MRLKTRAEFLAVRKGARAGRPSVVVEALRRAEAGPVGLGFTATKKIGSAVVRNRAKRRLRAAATATAGQFVPGCNYVLIARDSTAEAPWLSLLDDVGRALIRLRPALEGAFGAPEAPTRRPGRIKTDTD
ncbi:MAG: ribonuclease P protein component [Alphaproteobacteria bacterium]